MLNGLEANSPLAGRNHKLCSAVTSCTRNIQFKIYENFFILLLKNFSKKNSILYSNIFISRKKYLRTNILKYLLSLY